MLDPVANTLDLRAPFDGKRADRVKTAMRATNVGLSDVAYFDNMLVEDIAAREKKLMFMRRVFDAAEMLGTDAVCGFVGRNQALSMDQNLLFFEEVFVPLLKDAKARGLSFRVEQCPMPGGPRATTFTTTLRTPLGRGSRCTESAKSTGWGTSSAFITTPATRC